MSKKGLRMTGHRLLLAIAPALLVGLLSLFVLQSPTVAAPNLPGGFDQQLVDDGLSEPTAMELAPDGRLFATEKQGKLRVIKDGALLSDSFIDLTDKIDDEGERGLLGIAFDPDFENGRPYVYVYYTQKQTNAEPLHNRVSRFEAQGDVAVPDSEKVTFDLDHLDPSSARHNGGAIHFGQDDKLYVASGENGHNNKAQSLENTFGKLLRIDPNAPDTQNGKPRIPNDNPFFDRTNGNDKAIWALGLRNPFTFAVQPGTGKIHINDVGSQDWEEINKGKRGANYGWPRREGPGRDSRFTAPIFAYKHDGSNPNTTGCALTGGTFYNPENVEFPPGYEGDYFFADQCNGWIRKLDARSNEVSGFATNVGRPVDLKVSGDGALYFLDRIEGSVHEIRYTL